MRRAAPKPLPGARRDEESDASGVQGGDGRGEGKRIQACKRHRVRGVRGDRGSRGKVMARGEQKYVRQLRMR
jgi:hypothetical protein